MKSLILKLVIISFAAFGIYGYVQHNHAISKQQDDQVQADIVQATKIINDNTRKFLLEGCIKQADVNYNEFVKNNADYSVIGANSTPLYSMSKTKWDYVNSQKTANYAVCYKQF